MSRIICVGIVMVANVFAATTVYDVELSYNDNLSAREVSQSFVATADSVSEVAFFCGKKIIPGRYQFRLEYSDGSQLSEWIESDSAGLYEHELVSATFNPKVYVRKGFSYRLHVTHSVWPQCTTNFYYNSSDPYTEGEFIGHSGWDLAARIEGFNNFPKGLFGMNAHILQTYGSIPDSFYAMDKWAECIDSMGAMGVTWDRVGMNAWQHFQLDSVDIDSFHYEWCDSLMKLYAEEEINVLWYFTMSTKWAASDSRFHTDTVYYPFPSNLFEPVLDSAGSINQANYFAQYVFKFIMRYGPNGEFWQTQGTKNPIRYYEMWNEPEWGIRDDWWGDTTTITDPVYDSLIATQGDTTSLITVYSRLCIVGDSVVQIAAESLGVSDSLLTLVYLPYHHWDTNEWPRPDVWLDQLESHHVDEYCDGISFHSYATPTWEPLFHNRQKLTLDSIGIYQKNSDFRSKFLWCTEHSTGCFLAGDSVAGFPVQSDEQLATIATFSANDFPEGPLSHSFLWCFSHKYFNDTENDNMRLKCITRDDFEKRDPGYGFNQLTTMLQEYQLNGCLTDGTTYDTIRIYELENPATNRKLYVGWKEREIGGALLPSKLDKKGLDLCYTL